MPGTYKAIGDIDTTTAPAFNAALHDTIDDSDEAFVSVDCSRVTFLDPAGYHALVDATNYAARRGHTLVIRNMSPSCATLMRLYDWDRTLRFESLGTANEHGMGRGGVHAGALDPGSGVVARSAPADISASEDGWCAECLVCHSWISTHARTRSDAETAFERHLQNDYPHYLDERPRPTAPAATCVSPPSEDQLRGHAPGSPARAAS